MKIMEKRTSNRMNGNCISNNASKISVSLISFILGASVAVIGACSNMGNQVDLSTRNNITNTTLKYYSTHEASIRAKNEVALAEMKLIADLSQENKVDVEHVLRLAEESMKDYRPAAPPGFSFSGDEKTKEDVPATQEENVENTKKSYMEELPALKPLAKKK